jgi:threonylcarbamoyladenosine tRNA methylthiotransferase MtaB
LQAARATIPDVAITTDIIAGFPGETEAEFTETVEYIKAMNFAGGHIFTYSARPGTPAARMNRQVRHEVRKDRNTAIRAVLEESAQAYRLRFIGQILPVLWEASNILTAAGWRLEGLTDNYLRVTAIAPELRWNQIDKVKMVSIDGDEIRGKITIPHLHSNSRRKPSF